MPSFYRLLLIYPLIYLCTGIAIASETSPSPIQFLLSEAGITEADISLRGQSAFTPHIGYQALKFDTAKNNKVKIHRKSIKETRGIDKFHLNLGQDKELCEELDRKLIEKYGPAKSERNNIKIWEIANPDFSLGQSKTITIMSGEEKGRYFLKMNRQGSQKRYIAKRGTNFKARGKVGLNRVSSLNSSSKNISD